MTVGVKEQKKRKKKNMQLVEIRCESKKKERKTFAFIST